MGAQPAALSATYVDFKIIRTRSTAQIILEVPLEEADRALKILGGVPRPDVERWVAVARLNPAAPATEGEKPRKRWSELPRAQQAALACQDVAFQDFLMRRPAFKDAAALCTAKDSPDWPAETVRVICDVRSRADLNTNDSAARKWDALYLQYLTDTGRMAEARG